MSLPANWTLIPVTWTLIGQDGSPCNGVVRFTSAQVVTASGGTYVPETIEATVTNGVMAAVSLPSTDDPDISPTGWTWQVAALVSPQGPDAFYITVPAAGGTINLATVVPVSAAAPMTAVALADSALTAIVNDSTTTTSAALTAKYAPNALTDYTKLRPFFAALAGRDTARVNVVMVGASITEGYGLTFDQTIEMQLARNLRSMLPTTGLTGGGRGRIGQAATSAGTFPWTYGTTGGGNAGAYDETFHIGANHRTWKMTANGSGTAYTWAKVTLNGSITSFDINYVKTALGGTNYGYYKIDGGGAVAFSTNAATPTPTTLHVASAATSTIEIGCLNGTMYLDGVTEYAGDESKGIQVHNVGHGSYTVNNWNTNFVAGCWAYSIAALLPDLLILSDLGINDMVTSVGNRTPAQFKADLLSFIVNLRAAGITCPIVLALNYTVAAASLTYAAPWSQYVQQMKDIASADSTIVTVSHYDRMPDTTNTALGLYQGDQLHGTDRGYGYMADTLAALITPR